MSITTKVLAAILVLASVGAAQEQMPKAGPEVKKLDVFAGEWGLESTVKASAMGPAGTVTEKQKCEWMEGGFFLVCHSDYKGTMGNWVGLAAMGYAGEDRAYTYRSFDSFGEFTDAKGTLAGDIWTFTTDYKIGNTTMKGRYTMRFTSATTYNLMFDMSQDGVKWTNAMEGKAVKK